MRRGHHCSPQGLQARLPQEKPGSVRECASYICCGKAPLPFKNYSVPVFIHRSMLHWQHIPADDILSQFSPVAIQYKKCCSQTGCTKKRLRIYLLPGTNQVCATGAFSASMVKSTYAHICTKPEKISFYVFIHRLQTVAKEPAADAFFSGKMRLARGF